MFMNVLIPPLNTPPRRKMEADAYANKRLMGRRTTYRNLAKHMAGMLLGTAGRPPMNLTQAAAQLGYKDLKQARAIRNLAVDLGYLQVGPGGRAARPERAARDAAFVDNDTFCQHPLIKPWAADLMNRKQGRPLKGARGVITSFRTLCDFLKADPEIFITGPDHGAVLTSVREIMQGVNTEIRAGRFPHRKKGSDPAFIIHRLVRAVRDFMAYHGYSYQRGTSGVMGQRKLSHGKFAHVKLTKDQIDAALDRIAGTHGIDSDLYRAFAFGIQSCARRSAIQTARIDRREWSTTPKGIPLLMVWVHETKTEDDWPKYITWPDLQKSIEKQAARGPYLLTNRTEKGMDEIADQLRDLYRWLNPPDLKYFLDHPFHALRHTGAHYWLEICNYNHSLVAEMGGWKSDEVRQSYGRIPADRVLGALGI